jgi:hypothetical protein
MPMNKTLCLLILLVSISSQADTLTGVVVGSMIAHNNQPEVQAAPIDHVTMILEYRKLRSTLNQYRWV